MSAAPTDNEELARRIAAGEAAAEEELVQQLGRGTSLLLRRLARDPELAQDLYQETFRIVITGLRQGKLHDPTKLAAYVRGTAKNLLRSEWRKRDRRGPHDDVDDLSLVDPSPGQWHEASLAEDRAHVRRV
ncbi:MAG: sigma factor, partial [Acidobacteriota bacterium]